MAEKKKGGDALIEDAEKQKAEELAQRTYMASEAQWESAGEEFGGKSEILIIQVGEVAGPFIYVGRQEMVTELGPTTVHLATDKDGETLRLPIQATFQRSVDQADLIRGDEFLIKRFEDQDKKRGKGAGKPMAIYGLKVTKRATRAAAA